MTTPQRISHQLMIVLTTVLLALAFVFPLHLTPWSTFYNELLFAVAIILVLSIYLDRSPTFDIRFHTICATLFVLPLMHTLCAHGNAVLEQTWVWGAYMVVAVLAHHIGAQRKAPRGIDMVLWPVAIAALLSVVVATLQWTGTLAKGDWDPAFFFPSQGGGRTASNIAQANNFGTLLIVGFWSVLHLTLRPWQHPWARRLAPWLAGLGAAALTFGVYLSGSRTATLNLILAPILVACWLRWRGQKLRSSLLAWSLAPIGLLLVLQLIMPPLAEALGLPSPPEDRSLTSDSARLRLWSMAWAAVLESPWWGHGLTAMAEAHLRLSPVYGAIDYRIAAHAHNTVLDLLLMFGIPLGATVAACVAWLWWRAWRAAQEPAQLWVWLMGTAMLVHALLEYPLHYGFFLWLWCLLAGHLTGAPGRPIHLRWPLLASLVWLMLSVAAAYPIWRGYLEVEKLYTLLRQQGTNAVRVGLPAVHPWSRALYPGLLARLDWLTRPTSDIAALSDEEMQQLVRTAHGYPLPGLLWRTTLAYAYRGDAQSAAWYGQRLCSMFHPGLCEQAVKEWPELGKDRANWPDLPWQAWLEAPVPGRPPPSSTVGAATSQADARGSE